MSEKLTQENYYESYQYQGWNLSLLYERMRNIQIPEDILRSIQEKEKIRLLVLGSATTENLHQIAKIDQYLHPGKVEDDDAVIIDLNKYPLDQHKKYVDWIEGKDSWTNTPKSTPEFPYPKFDLVQTDMRQLPFAEGSFDILISDYTLNYIDNPTDLGKVFTQIAQVLSLDGLAIVAVRGTQHGNQKTGDNKALSEAEHTTQGGVEVHYFPLQTYLRIAAEHGLEVVTQSLLSNDLCVVLKKMVTG